METLAIFRIWAAAAWSDDVLHPSEEKALRRFLDRATDLTPADRAAALAMIDKKPEVVLENEVKNLSQSVKADLYRAVLATVELDGKVTPEEKAFVSRLRDQLALPPSLVRRIDDETHH